MNIDPNVLHSEFIILHSAIGLLLYHKLPRRRTPLADLKFHRAGALGAVPGVVLAGRIAV